MKIKFKSGINRIFLISVIIFNIVIAMLFTTKILTVTNVGVKIGFLLLAIDLIFVIPMFFLTFYEFKDEYLYVHDYPVRAYKIKYSDIFTVEDGDFEAKNKRIVALSMDRIAIGYKKINKDEVEEEVYIYISPLEMNLFLTRLSGKLEQYKTVAEDKAKELSEKQIEHNRKKKIADKKKQEQEKENQPEIVEVTEIKKYSGFDTVSDTENNQPNETKADEETVTTKQ